MQEKDKEVQRRTVCILYGEGASADAKVISIHQFLENEGLTVFHKENIVKLAWEAAPLVGSELLAATPFIGDELAVAFKYARAVIILLTGEERVRLCAEFQREDDEEFEKMFCLQPTQEQIFEAGYAFGMQPMRTILMQIGDVRPFSDIAGRHILPFTGADQDYDLLRTRLRVAEDIMERDSEADIAQLSSTVQEDTRDPQKVFVVHGRDVAAKSAMFSFLRSLKLTPIEWDEAVGLAEMGSPYTGEAVVAGIDEAQAVVVLLTGDDLVQLEKPSVMGQFLSQARPNVLFEAGMAFSRCRKGTILVRLGNVRPCRDMDGRSMIKLTNKSTSRGKLIERLSHANCLVQLDGNWHSSGNFEARTCS